VSLNEVDLQALERRLTVALVLTWTGHANTWTVHFRWCRRMHRRRLNAMPEHPDSASVDLSRQLLERSQRRAGELMAV
jgi:hypothetical protein